MKIKKDLPILLIIILPFIYLIYIWNELPDKVPLHWNSQMEIDRYGTKYEILPIIFSLTLMIYLIFLVIPLIDPKNMLNKMGDKYQKIKFLVTTLTSLLSLIIIYSIKNESIFNPNFIILLVGAFYLVLGNYFKTIKPNYFIGIRTPWTLEDKNVWDKTHTLGGEMWFIGGLMVVISSLILEVKMNLNLFFIISTIIFVVPIVYSYFTYKNKNI
jgi:uncharacterized membrane protein